MKASLTGRLSTDTKPPLTLLLFTTPCSTTHLIDTSRALRVTRSSSAQSSARVARPSRRFRLNTEVAFAFIDRVLGGEGNASTKARTLTEIEDAMMKKFMESAVANLKDAWANVVEIHPHVETMESNPQFAQIVSPSDMVIIVTIQVSICGVEGMMNICVPYLVLEPIMSKLTTTFWVASSQAKDDTPEHVEILQRKIERTKVPFIVELGNVYISIQEFMTLRFGDVLQLDTNVQDQLKCRVGARAKYLCRPGTSGKKVAVQITHILNEAEEESLEGDDLTNG